VQPLRQRPRFEPDPRNREAKPLKELDPSGSLATLISLTILPLASTMHTLDHSKDPSIPACCSIPVLHFAMGPNQLGTSFLSYRGTATLRLTRSRAHYGINAREAVWRSAISVRLRPSRDPLTRNCSSGCDTEADAVAVPALWSDLAMKSKSPALWFAMKSKSTRREAVWGSAISMCLRLASYPTPSSSYGPFRPVRAHRRNRRKRLGRGTCDAPTGLVLGNWGRRRPCCR
jgi:hypothetical protein